MRARLLSAALKLLLVWAGVVGQAAAGGALR